MRVVGPHEGVRDGRRRVGLRARRKVERRGEHESGAAVGHARRVGPAVGVAVREGVGVVATRRGELGTRPAVGVVPAVGRGEGERGVQKARATVGRRGARPVQRRAHRGREGEVRRAVGAGGPRRGERRERDRCGVGGPRRDGPRRVSTLEDREAVPAEFCPGRGVDADDGPRGRVGGVQRDLPGEPQRARGRPHEHAARGRRGAEAGRDEARLARAARAGDALSRRGDSRHAEAERRPLRRLGRPHALGVGLDRAGLDRPTRVHDGPGGVHDDERRVVRDLDAADGGAEIDVRQARPARAAHARHDGLAGRTHCDVREGGPLGQAGGLRAGRGAERDGEPEEEQRTHRRGAA